MSGDLRHGQRHGFQLEIHDQSFVWHLVIGRNNRLAGARQSRAAGRKVKAPPFRAGEGDQRHQSAAGTTETCHWRKKASVVPEGTRNLIGQSIPRAEARGYHLASRGARLATSSAHGKPRTAKSDPRYSIPGASAIPPCGSAGI